MNNLDFIHIEQTLNIALPSDYKQLLRSYPTEIAEAKELHLSDDPDWLIEQNLYVREQPNAFFGKKQWLPVLAVTVPVYLCILPFLVI